LCKRQFFSFAPQAILGGGKVEIRALDFYFSTAHSSSCVWFVLLVAEAAGVGRLEAPEPPQRRAGRLRIARDVDAVTLRGVLAAVEPEGC
jgi:hypothetical protein